MATTTTLLRCRSSPSSCCSVSPSSSSTAGISSLAARRIQLLFSTTISSRSSHYLVTSTTSRFSSSTSTPTAAAVTPRRHGFHSVTSASSSTSSASSSSTTAASVTGDICNKSDHNQQQYQHQHQYYLNQQHPHYHLSSHHYTSSHQQNYQQYRNYNYNGHNNNNTNTISWMRTTGPLLLTVATAALGLYLPPSQQRNFAFAEARKVHTTSASGGGGGGNSNDDETNPDATSTTKNRQRKPCFSQFHQIHAGDQPLPHCPFYGCPLTPQDVHYNTATVKSALEQLRQVSRSKGADTDAERLLSDSATPAAVTLTLIGYKGGSLAEQINQDRAIVVQPFFVATNTNGNTTTTSLSETNNNATNSSSSSSSSINSTSSELSNTTTATKSKSLAAGRVTAAGKEAAAAREALVAQLPKIPPGVLLGVFDGHAPKGELVSEFARSELPVLLSRKLQQQLQDYAIVATKNLTLHPLVFNANTTAAANANATNQSSTSNNNTKNSEKTTTTNSNETTVTSNPTTAASLWWHSINEEEIANITKKVIIDTFIELDKRAPADESGGCTATVVLRLLNKIYIANAGDSRSFVVAYRPSTRQTNVLYVSREDKPSLPDERARVEAAGGQVYVPVRGTSRVVYYDPRTGSPSGLAMSRSLGDWAAGKLGVIPDPIVGVLDISDIIDNEMLEPATGKKATETILNESGETVSSSSKNKKNQESSWFGSSPEEEENEEDDVHIFAVSATDGMMDYLEPEDIAKVLADALFDDDGAHPISAAEHLVFAAANAWQQEKQGRYRDDIAIAVSTIRLPPKKKIAPETSTNTTSSETNSTSQAGKGESLAQ